MPITRQFTATERKWLEDVASALADALLAGPWLVDAMTERARRTVGDARWVNELVRGTHLGYPTPPADRPRELTRFLMVDPPLPEVFAAALDNDRPIPVVYHRFVSATRMVAHGHAVPTWNTTVDVANYLGLTIGELDWFADTQGRETRVADEQLRHYRYRLLAKRQGGFRLLESPKWQLRELQRRILHEVLDHIPTHDAVHGFRRERSPISHASSHVGARCVIRIDLTNFFARVTAGRVWGLFRLVGYPEQVAYTLTGLVTNTVPADVRRNCDPLLAMALAGPHLPQGAPTSPALANLAAYRLDRRLAGLADRIGINYTRYADDLAFSGGPELLRRAGNFVSLVRRIARDEGFAVNPAKTAVLGAHNRQQLTGIVVNELPNVPRSEFDRLKATLHNCITRGPAGQNRAGHADFPAHLAGRIAWVNAVNPRRGARLREMFEQIDFTGVNPTNNA
jgi:RNA-directed DNA polymerase